MKGVNDGFGKLNLYVPNMRAKSSRVENLRGAIEYIKTLKELLGEEIEQSSFQSTSFSDDSSTIYNMSSSYANTSRERVPDLHEVEVHPMVYQLPPTISYPPPANSSPILLPPVSSLSHSQDRSLFLTMQLPSMSSIFQHVFPDVVV